MTDGQAVVITVVMTLTGTVVAFIGLAILAVLAQIRDKL